MGPSKRLCKAAKGALLQGEDAVIAVVARSDRAGWPDPMVQASRIPEDQDVVLVVTTNRLLVMETLGRGHVGEPYLGAGPHKLLEPRRAQAQPGHGDRSSCVPRRLDRRADDADGQGHPRPAGRLPPPPARAGRPSRLSGPRLRAPSVDPSYPSRREDVRRVGVVLSLLATGVAVVTDIAPAAADHGDITTFVDPEGEVDGPTSIVEGPDGMLWFTSTVNDRIGRLDPSAEDPALTITTFTDPGLTAPGDIVLGPDDELWFTADGAIGRMDPGSEAITMFPDASIDGARGITVGPDYALWFTAEVSDRIGRITTDGVITTFTDPHLDGPRGDRRRLRKPASDGFANAGGHDVGQITTAERLHVPRRARTSRTRQTRRTSSWGTRSSCSTAPPTTPSGHPAAGERRRRSSLARPSTDAGAMDTRSGLPRSELVGRQPGIRLSSRSWHGDPRSSSSPTDEIDLPLDVLIARRWRQLWFTSHDNDRVGRLEIDGTTAVGSPCGRRRRG